MMDGQGRHHQVERADRRELSRTGPAEVLLFTDLHAGNVLSGERRPWLLIDSRPYVG